VRIAKSQSLTPDLRLISGGKRRVSLSGASAQFARTMGAKTQAVNSNILRGFGY
jgi:hypothetical protein